MCTQCKTEDGRALLTANMSPRVKICAGVNWKNCTEPISRSSQCVSADRLNDVVSIAIDLGLCCRFYRLVCFCSLCFSSCSDGNCSASWLGWGGTPVWYPDAGALGDDFRQGVGSYTCTQTSRVENCPGLGGANVTASASLASVTPSPISSYYA
jgi:hypothetical protein